MDHVLEGRSPPFCRAAEGKIEQLDAGIRRQMLAYGPDLMLCRVWFDRGAVGQVHSHPHSQASYIESGRFRVVIDGEQRDLGAADAFFIAPDLEHSATCLEAGVILDAFSPAREDFLEMEG